ncbi:hypothetical protein GGD64_004035 [Bradyrhizobium sp. CIR3A]|nr:hypothetical protein [Bradyrhizobium sp. CIR3A]NYG46310.1 hypothetical protein [Bradyrhizobium sp. IAR9]
MRCKRIACGASKDERPRYSGLSPFEASASLRRLRVTVTDESSQYVGIRIFIADTRSQTHVRILAAHLARALLDLFTLIERGRREDREPAGTRGPLCEICVTRSCTAAYRCSQDIPAFPAQWLYGLCRALPGERCTIAPVALRMAGGCVRLDDTHHHKTWRTDPGRQDDTILPYADHTGRVREVFAHGYPPCEAVRADVTCVHRRPARVRDDRDTPLFLGPG